MIRPGSDTKGLKIEFGDLFFADFNRIERVLPSPLYGNLFCQNKLAELVGIPHPSTSSPLPPPPLNKKYPLDNFPYKENGWNKSL